MDALQAGDEGRAGRGINFSIGGALASTTYSGQWRNTKDIDLYIRKSDREKMVEVLSGAGLADYYDQKPYDRDWIYRSCRDDLIVDVMWAMAKMRNLHDNKGGQADLHLPLGAGTVDLRASVAALQAYGYDGTITLEVFTPDRRHLMYSRDVLRNAWNDGAKKSSVKPEFARV